MSSNLLRQVVYEGCARPTKCAGRRRIRKPARPAARPPRWAEAKTSPIGGVLSIQIGNALTDALAPLGAEIFELPMTAKRLFRPIKMVEARTKGG